ncbi:hypothetical protein FP435_02285 [Lactobacillus sp. PV037]|uniref:hypothetical protein n=1 Tax=Lactobacillus sp. PV037 TaxID=2594496 RepID=UPI00223F7747|nr:hypothetical protein [Lactobacillus sp. PV037]QNQ83345.1 hypothetical protein FP435_02285 [Lactobacillus sp. PV037]
MTGFIEIHAYIHKTLSQGNVKTLRVTTLCRDLNITRSNFYRVHQTLNSVLRRAVVYEMKYHLRMRQQEKLPGRLLYLLARIKEDMNFYYNIYKLALEKRCNCEFYKKEIREYLKRVAPEVSKENDEILMTASQLIFNRLYDWIRHQCADGTQLVYRDLLYLLEHAGITKGEIFY